MFTAAFNAAVFDGVAFNAAIGAAAPPPTVPVTPDWSQATYVAASAIPDSTQAQWACAAATPDWSQAAWIGTAPDPSASTWEY